MRVLSDKRGGLDVFEEHTCVDDQFEFFYNMKIAGTRTSHRGSKRSLANCGSLRSEGQSGTPADSLDERQMNLDPFDRSRRRWA